MLIGLTGGLASGKSRVGQWFADHGWVVICSDQIVHDLYEPGQPMPAELAREFGPEILTSEGRVDRQHLGEIVFQDESRLKRLNALVHQHVRVRWKQQATESVRQGQPTLVVIPLLYETGAESEFQQVWVVACSATEQIKRLHDRGFDETQITCRLAAQWLLQKKMDLAHVVIWNEGDWALTEEQLQEAMTKI